MTEKKEFTKEVMLRAADEIYYVQEGHTSQREIGGEYIEVPRPSGLTAPHGKTARQ